MHQDWGHDIGSGVTHPSLHILMGIVLVAGQLVGGVTGFAALCFMICWLGICPPAVCSVARLPSRAFAGISGGPRSGRAGRKDTSAPLGTAAGRGWGRAGRNPTSARHTPGSCGAADGNWAWGLLGGRWFLGCLLAFALGFGGGGGGGGVASERARVWGTQHPPPPRPDSSTEVRV